VRVKLEDQIRLHDALNDHPEVIVRFVHGDFYCLRNRNRYSVFLAVGKTATTT